MAIPIKDRVRYDQMHEELKLHLHPPYADAVSDILKQKGVEVNTTKIYNVVQGHTKDFTILYALREYFDLPNHEEQNPADTLLKRQRLNMPKAP